MTIQGEHVARLDNKCNIIDRKKTIDIKCSNNSCKKVLAILLHQNKEDNVLYKLCIKCPFCNSKSYDFDVKGDISWIMGDGIKLSKIEEDDLNNRVIWETAS